MHQSLNLELFISLLVFLAGFTLLYSREVPVRIAGAFLGTAAAIIAARATAPAFWEGLAVLVLASGVATVFCGAGWYRGWRVDDPAAGYRRQNEASSVTSAGSAPQESHEQEP